MSTAEWECPTADDNGYCPSRNAEDPSGAMLEDVTGADSGASESQATYLDDPYGYFGGSNPGSGSVTGELPSIWDRYGYSGDPSFNGDAPGDSGAAPGAKDATLQKLGQLEQSDTLEKGMVLYDIAREALAARGSITDEKVDHDTIMRECNRIMVLNGYPDAHLEGKTDIGMGDLPRAWNGVRWNQEFKLYDESTLNAFSDLALQNADPPPPAQGDPPPAQGDPPPAQGDTPPARTSVEDANGFFVCQFLDRRFNPNGHPSSNDCGPAALSMIARYHDVQLTDPELGPIEAGNADPAQLISAVRYAMTGARDEQKFTGLGQMETAAAAMGLDASKVKGLTDLDLALDSGKMVILSGNPKDYQADLGLTYGRGGTIYDGGHFITVVGRQGNDYIVNDPANHGGSMTLTREQVEKYVSYVNPENMGLAVFKGPNDRTDPGGQPAPVHQEIEWDTRLDALNASFVPIQDLKPGQQYWRLVSAKYLPAGEGEGESRGRHHIFYKVLDESGQPQAGKSISMSWADGQSSDVTKGEDEFRGNQPLYASFAPERGERGPYSAFVTADGLSSDKVQGLGLPLKQHVSYELTFQLSTWQDEANSNSSTVKR